MFPVHGRELTCALLSRALNESVTAVNIRRLDGGVHYEVVQCEVKTEDKNDRSMVVKVFNVQGEGLWMRWIHFLAQTPVFRCLPYLASTRVTHQTLESYRIESRVYTSMQQLRRFLPNVLAAHSEPWMGQYLLILQDLGAYNRGEPRGFLLSDAFVLVRALADIHACSLRSPALRDQATAERVWTHGGYWFGPKEILDGVSPVVAANALKHAFDLDLDCLDTLALQLQDCIGALSKIVHCLEPRVLIHGDYKLSNLFIDPTNRVYAIDWQWFGHGTPATDLAYFVYTSVRAGALIDPPDCSCAVHSDDSMDPGAEDHREYQAFMGQASPIKRSTAPRAKVLGNDRAYYHYYGDQEWDLMCAYFDALAPTHKECTFAAFERAYRLNVIYFAYFCLTCKYAQHTPDIMRQYACVPEDGLHLRTLAHMKRLLLRANDMLRHSPSLWPHVFVH